MIELQKLEAKQKIKLIEQIESFAYLEVNWDSYGARPITFSARKSAIAIVNAMFIWAHAALPQAMPEAHGGVVLFWGDEDIYINIDEKGFARVWTDDVPEEEFGT